MNIKWILLSVDEYSLPGQTEGGKKVLFWTGQGVQGEITLKSA